MRAVVYDKPFSVSVQEVEKPQLQHPNDITVKSGLPSSALFLGEKFTNHQRNLNSYDFVHLWQVGPTISAKSGP